jgi:hypothetical protein
MGKTRDIAAFLGKTEAFNTTNKRLAIDSNDISTLTPTIATDIINQYGVVVYSTVDSLPASPNDGDRAWVTGNNRFYIADSSWHNALLINTPPTINILNYDSALNDSSSLTMTIQVTDSFENLDIISFGATISPSNITDSAVLTFSRDSSVIALAISNDSANEATSFTITFSANDQVNLATSVKSFTIDKGFILTPTDVYVSSLLSSTTTAVYVDSDVTNIFQDADVINDNNGNDATITDITMENLTLRGTESTSFESTSSIIYSDADLSSTVSTGQIIAASNIVTSGNLGRDEAGYTRYGEVTNVTYSAGGPSSSSQVTNAATYLGPIKVLAAGVSYPYVSGYAFSYNGTFFSTNGSTAQYYHLNPSSNTINTSYLWPYSPGAGTVYLVGTYSYLASGFENIGSGAFDARWYSGAFTGASTHYKRNTQTIGSTPGTTYNFTVQGNQTSYYSNGSAISFDSTYQTTGGNWYVVSNPTYDSGTNTTTVPLQTYVPQTFQKNNGQSFSVRKNSSSVTTYNWVYYMFIPLNTSTGWSNTVNAGVSAGSSFRPYNVYGYTAANTAITYTHGGTSPGSGTLISNGGQIYTGNPTTKLTVDAGGTQFTSGERIYLKT